MNKYLINNQLLKLSISQAIEESFLNLADTLSERLTHYELENKNDPFRLQEIMAENNQISAYMDQLLISHLLQMLEGLD